MNYLAHAYLSNNNEGLLLGNFIADHIKGNNFEHLSNDIKLGIALHRQIDSFTDSHALFKQSKRLFYNGFEKYSGVLVDIYFDHFLASNFEQYSPVKLPDFTQNVYGVYQKNIHLLPDSSARFLGYVLKNNIYTAYSKIEGIEKVLFHLSQRINHGIMLNNSIQLFTSHRAELLQNFEAFMMDIRKEFLSI